MVQKGPRTAMNIELRKLSDIRPYENNSSP